MLNYLNWTVDELFTKAAATEPEPGGGGVSAISGVLGLGMLTMVAQISLAKEKDPILIGKFKEILGALGESSARLKTLTQQDMQAYQEFMRALSLPNKTPEEKDLRQEKKQQAAILSAKVPMEMAKSCLVGLQVAKDLASIGSKYAISDVGVGANLLEAALKGALLLVDANIPYISMANKADELKQQSEILLQEAAGLSLNTLKIVRERM
ncbi:cyclodeaminase/cyclohydrolase family protein [Desulfotomaculum defluvii]